MKPLTELQEVVYKLNQSGLNQKAIATQLGRSQASISECLLLVEKKGYLVKRFYVMKKPLEAINQ